MAITKFPYLSPRVLEHVSAEDLKETLLCSAAAYPAAPIYNHKNSVCVSMEDSLDFPARDRRGYGNG